ncbi:MAG: HAD-IIA family hydrolase [Candidatus Kerfeldbacteria bacterium]|nr:HAD-IIA family hydrolase [Candidatus Kerfeldbacteria bacterium]
MRMLATSIQDCEAILVDVGGTLLHGEKMIEGASDFLFALKKKQIPFYITANNVSESTQEILERLKNVGCSVSIDDMITASQSAIAWARLHNITSVRVMGTVAQTLEWREAGFDTTATQPHALILGRDETINYESLTEAMRAMHTGAKLIALSDSAFHMNGVAVLPSVGPVIQYLKEVTGRAPDCISGKPHAQMFRYITSRVGVPAAHIAVIGDQLTADMKLAEEYGMVSALVLSGQTTREDVQESAYQPDYVVESVESLTPLFR